MIVGVEESGPFAQHRGDDRLGDARVIGAGLHMQDAGIVVIVHFQPRFHVVLKAGERGIGGIEPREAVAPGIGIVRAQMQAGVEPGEHVLRQQVIAQQHLVGAVAPPAPARPESKPPNPPGSIAPMSARCTTTSVSET
jgi:hypothetical protein